MYVPPGMLALLWQRNNNNDDNNNNIATCCCGTCSSSSNHDRKNGCLRGVRTRARLGQRGSSPSQGQGLAERDGLILEEEEEPMVPVG